MEYIVQREPTIKHTTFGRLWSEDDGEILCHTLEDVIREIPGVPVEQWKIKNETAIPQGRYELELVDSPHFGPDTLSLKNVPGFSLIRIHAGNDDSDTDGCILVGTRRVEDPIGDGGDLAQSQKALARVKAEIVPRLKGGELCFLTVRNP